MFMLICDGGADEGRVVYVQDEGDEVVCNVRAGEMKSSMKVVDGEGDGEGLGM